MPSRPLPLHNVDLRGRDVLKEADFSRDELQYLIDLAAQLKVHKRERAEEQFLRGRNIALIFEKSSTRTRCAFEVGAYDQGAHVTYLDPSSSQLGHKESAADTARVLCRMYDGIQFRGSAQATIETLAAFSSVPVYNGLTDDWHPTQMLADFLTMTQHLNRPTDAISYAYLGDARSNMGNSLLMMGAIMGSDVRIAAPKALWPRDEVQELARARAAESGAKITLTDDPASAVAGVDFIHTDVWVSMGEPVDIWDERISLLRPYQVNADVITSTGNPATKFMHCLPSFHDMNTVVGQQIAARTGMVDGLEVTDSLFESDVNICWEQAENRLHTVKAAMVATLAD